MACAMPSTPLSTCITLSTCAMALPWLAVMAISGSSVAKRFIIMPRKPLNTLSTHTSAAVVTTTPSSEMMLMMFTALWAFFDTR